MLRIDHPSATWDPFHIQFWATKMFGFTLPATMPLEWPAQHSMDKFGHWKIWRLDQNGKNYRWKCQNQMPNMPPIWIFCTWRKVLNYSWHMKIWEYCSQNCPFNVFPSILFLPNTNLHKNIYSFYFNLDKILKLQFVKFHLIDLVTIKEREGGKERQYSIGV